MTRCLLVVLVLAACADRHTEPPTQDASTREKAGGKTDPSTCMPAGLESAKPLEVVALPRSCHWTRAGSLDAPVRISEAAELDTALACDPPATRPGIDLAAHALEVVELSMSPAYAGTSIVDDGSVVTFVMRQRSPCPNDPMPMPMNTSLAYRIDEDAARKYQTLACTLPPSCP